MSFEPRDYLRHILDEAEYLIRTSEDLTAGEFLASATLRRAFMRSLEVLGEAANQVPGEFQIEYSDLEVRLISVAPVNALSAPQVNASRLRRSGTVTCT